MGRTLAYKAETFKNYVSQNLNHHPNCQRDSEQLPEYMNEVYFLLEQQVVSLGNHSEDLKKILFSSSIFPSLLPRFKSDRLWSTHILQCMNRGFQILKVHCRCRFKTFSHCIMETSCHSLSGLSVELRMKLSWVLFKTQSWKVSHSLAKQGKNLPKASNLQVTRIDGDLPVLSQLNACIHVHCG